MNANNDAQAPRPAITDDIIKALDESLKGRGQNQSSVNPRDNAIEMLTINVNQLHRIYASRRGWLHEYTIDAERFVEAINVLSELIPKMRGAHAQELETAQIATERHGQYLAEIFEKEAFKNIRPIEPPIAFAQANLNALDRLGEAVDEVIKRGVPISPVEFMSPNYGGGHSEKFHWRGFVAPIVEIFHNFLPGRTKEDGYRFVERIIPIITDGKPSIENIKELLKNRSPH